MALVKRAVSIRLRVLLLGALLAAGSTLAAEQEATAESGGQPVGESKAPQDSPPKPPREPKPAGSSGGGETVEVERAEVEVLIEAEGVLASRQEHAIRVATDRWSELRVLEAVPHGAVVRKGEVLVRFDTRRLEEGIADAEREIPAKEQALSLARAELERLRATEAGDLAKARRTCRETKADHDYYQATARPRKLLEEAQKLKRATELLDYEEEELRQLLMMYEADDLTEETEEIILKRQRSSVEYAGNSLERARVAHDRLVGTTIGRDDKEQEMKRQRADLELALAEVAIPHARKAKQHEVTAAEQALEKKKQALVELQGDLALLEGVRAPVDGVVFHGAVEAGRATTAAQLKSKLQPRGKLSPDEVVLTVVGQRPGVIHLKFKEKDLRHLREGMVGVARLEGVADGRVAVELLELGLVPGVAGDYAGLASMVGEAPADAAQPGRSARVVFQVFHDPAALVLPAKVVDERIRAGQLEEIVYLPGEAGGEAAARVVRTGPRDGDRITIVSGLEEGTQVLVEKP